MAISNITGWNSESNPVTPIQNLITIPGTSAAIQGLTVPGTFTNNSKYYVAFVVDVFRGYKVTGISISSATNTIAITAQADSTATASRISDYVETSEDFQSNNFTMNFEVTVGAESKKTYTFKKGNIGGGRPHL